METKPTLVENGPVFEATKLVHRVLSPEREGPFPTVVMIHGRLGNEDVMWIFARTLPPNFQIISVRAIFEEEDGYSWNPPLGRLPTLNEMDDAVTAVTHFIQMLPKVYQADPEQIYLMGFSQGAAASFATAIKNPDLVQGIAALVGFLPEVNDELIDQKPLDSLPVFMAVGAKDDTISLDVSRQSGKALRSAGADLTYEEFQTGHKLNGAGMRQLKSWWEILTRS